MPMIELSLTRSALAEEELQTPMRRAANVLMWWEKLPDTLKARRIAWSHATEFEPGQLFIGGQPPLKPRHRYKVHTIEGLMDDRAKQGVMRDLMRLLLEIEGAPQDDENKARV